MKKRKMELTAFPIIEQEDGNESYGGSQDWLATVWRRRSGCAAVSATNLAAYYGIGMPKQARYSREIYTQQADAMFADYMRTGMMGFPDPDKYIEKFLSYASANGVHLQVEKQYTRATVREAVDFLLPCLRAGDPVVILILNHRDDVLDDIRWHWMTITGYDEETEELIVSNYGKKERWSAASIFAVHENNQVYLIAFSLII